MGGIVHLVGDSVREAAARRDYQAAKKLVFDGLEIEPGNPDLLCERAILCLYEGREREAAELLPLAIEGNRYALLAQLLCDHAYCLLQLNPADVWAQEIFGVLTSLYGPPSKTVGIRVTACLIVKNEEDNLHRCLSSLVGVVDEIVVVDTGSTDTSKSIAQSYGAVVDEIAWNHDFAAARNRSLELATGHWALWIDADEELGPDFAKQLKRAIVRPCFGAFDIEIVNYTDREGDAGQFRHCATRLFRNIPEVRFSGRIHEQVCPALVELGMPWVRLPGAFLLHHGYRPEAMEKRSKSDRTVSMLEREVRENPSDAFQWFNLGNAYLVASRLAEAEHAARRCIALMGKGAVYAQSAYHILAQAASGGGRISAALAACTEAEMQGYGGIPILFEKCQALLRDNRPQDALDAADRLLIMNWPDGSTGDRGIYTHKRFVLRGQILAVLGRLDEALEMLDQAFEVDPCFAPTSYSRGAVLEKLARYEEALDAFTRAASDVSSFSLAMKGRGRILISLERFQEAAAAFRFVWEQDSKDFDAWVGWTGACEAGGDIAAVLEAYEAFAHIHEMNAEILINWGRALDLSGNSERALHCFTEAIKREPSSANAYFNCGDLLYRNGSPNDAAHLYEAGLRFAPGNSDAWFTYGNALARSGIPGRAAQAYRNALDQNPNHQGAKHNLAVMEEPEVLAA